MEPPAGMSRVRRVLFTATGFAATGLGVLGIILPLMPATPFLLLAAYFFSRSSPRFHRWLLTNRVFGSYIENYRSGRGLSLTEKVVTIATLWIALAITAATAVGVWWGRALLLAVAIGVTTHLLRLPTCRPAPVDERLPTGQVRR
ncbi:MAG TPA: YbaN family protein [Vicinamibacterales bacterium]|nr:YbaN family protein [Vicinamibacterales bacterium]